MAYYFKTGVLLGAFAFYIFTLGTQRRIVISNIAVTFHWKAIQGYTKEYINIS